MESKPNGGVSLTFALNLRSRHINHLEGEEKMYFTHISKLQFILTTCLLDWLWFRKMLNKNYLGKVARKAAKLKNEGTLK